MGEDRSRISTGILDIFREFAAWNLDAELNPNCLPDPNPRRSRHLPRYRELSPTSSMFPSFTREQKIRTCVSRMQQRQTAVAAASG
jgi:hypothetical protein